MQNQTYAFVMFILNGLLIGILFDIFRIFRKSFKTPDWITYIEDTLFWILSGLILLYSIFKFNNGELRFFVFMGVIFGISIYILIFSKMFIKVCVYIINFIKKLFKILIIIPTKFIIKILNKTIYNPFIFLYKNIAKLIRKTMSFFRIKSKKLFTKNRIYKNKKDFA